MISVFVPCLNEAENVETTVATILDAARLAGIADIEIIAVNDGSVDTTLEVLNKLKCAHPEVQVIDNETNLGLGKSLRKALAAAKREKFIIIPGDNDISKDLIVAMFSSAHKADLIMSYFLNREIRGVRRNVISTIFSSIYMITFGIFVQYINGPCIYPIEKVRALNLQSNRFSIVVETTLKLLCQGCTYHEVAGYMQKGLAGSTSLSAKNLTEVMTSYLRLVRDIKFREREKYGKSPIRVY